MRRWSLTMPFCLELDYVLADTRDGHRSPIATGPTLGYPHPARAEFVVRCFPGPRGS